DREIPAELATRLASFTTHRPSLSIYTWTEIEGMSSNGSLFLHHLRAEGRPLFEGTSVSGKLRSHLDRLKPYSRPRHDLEAFKAGLREARESLLGGGSIPFELSVIATLVRHSSILGCYVMGQPTFGRISPVEFVAAKWGLGQSLVVDFSALYYYKLLA